MEAPAWPQLRDPHPGQDLAGVERVLQVVDEELGGRDLPLAPRRARHEHAVQRQHHRPRPARPPPAPAAPGNPFLAWEAAWADAVEAGIDAWRDWRDAQTEILFHAVYGALAALGVATGTPEDPQAAGIEALAEAPEVRAALERIHEGGYAEAVIRMMVLLAQARGGVRRTRLARSNALLTSESPFAEMTSAARQALIREQTVIATMAPEEALATLPALLRTPEERRRALKAVEDVAGPDEELGNKALDMLRRQRALLTASPSLPAARPAEANEAPAAEEAAPIPEVAPAPAAARAEAVPGAAQAPLAFPAETTADPVIAAAVEATLAEAPARSAKPKRPRGQASGPSPSPTRSGRSKPKA